VNPLHADSLLAFACLGDVVGALHPHKRVHLSMPNPFSVRSAMLPERFALPLSRLDSVGRETLRAAAAVTERPAGSMISVRIKSPG
jgi:hypothetical protein